MIRVGLIAEGPSDCLALEEMIRTVEPEADFLRIPTPCVKSWPESGWSARSCQISLYLPLHP